MSFVKCVDTDNHNKSVVLVDGDIRFYEDVNGEPVMTTAITKTENCEVISGRKAISSNFFDENRPPSVFLALKNVKTFDMDYIGQDQILRVSHSDVTVANNHAEFFVDSTLKGGSSLSSNLIEIRRDHLVSMEMPPPGSDEYFSDIKSQWCIPINNNSEILKVRLYVLSWTTVSLPTSSPSRVDIYGAYWNYDIKIGLGTNGVNVWSKHLTGVKRSKEAPLELNVDISRNNNEKNLYIDAHCFANSDTICTGEIGSNDPDYMYTAFRYDCMDRGAVQPIFVIGIPSDKTIYDGRDNILNATVVGR